MTQIRDVLKYVIKCYISLNPGATFLEIEKIMDAFGFAREGTFSFRDPENMSIIYWSGMSFEAASLVDEILQEGYFLSPGMTRSYIGTSESGFVLDYPLVQAGQTVFDQTYWLPVLFYPDHGEEILSG